MTRAVGPAHLQGRAPLDRSTLSQLTLIYSSRFFQADRLHVRRFVRNRIAPQCERPHDSPIRTRNRQTRILRLGSCGGRCRDIAIRFRADGSNRPELDPSARHGSAGARRCARISGLDVVCAPGGHGGLPDRSARYCRAYVEPAISAGPVRVSHRTRHAVL